MSQGLRGVLRHSTLGVRPFRVGQVGVLGERLQRGPGDGLVVVDLENELDANPYKT
ncbi:hypothetical protein LV779_25290 [Streptomyces thinghirensis]|nr:hypothetical protein [Streptomyces thinghirensis]